MPTSDRRFSDRTFHHIPIRGLHTSANDKIRPKIFNFDNLRKNLHRKLTLDNWFLLTSHQHVHIFNVDKKTNGNLSIRITISIDTELMINVYNVSDETLFKEKLCDWPQLNALIEQFNVKQGREVYVVSVIDEVQPAETGGEVKNDYGIDPGLDAGSFEFCATNGVLDANEHSLVKIEPTNDDDILDWQNHLVYVKNETEELDEVTAERDRLELVRREYPASADNYDTRHCTICDKDFLTKKKFRNHMYLHDPRKFKKCEICNATCFNMRRHMECVHKNVKKDVCHICGAAYKQLSSLKDHVASKHSEAGQFFCDICKNGKNYRTKTFMKAHMKNTHVRSMQEINGGCPKFKCRWCNEQFTSKYALKYHEGSIHSNEKQPVKQFHCEICDKVFKRKQALTTHEILHLGKKYLCTECGQSFNHPDYLARHRKLHNEIRDKK